MDSTGSSLLDWFFGVPSTVVGGGASLLPALPPRPATGSSDDQPASEARQTRLKDLRRYVHKLRQIEPDRPDWDEDWWSLPDPVGASRCRSMYATALYHLLREAVDERLADYKRLGPSRTSERWVGSYDFYLLCDLAGIEGASEIAAEFARCAKSIATLSDLRERLSYVQLQ